MKSGVICSVISGISGAILGGAGVYFYMRNVYEKKLNEQIDSFKESQSPKKKDGESEDEDSDEKKSSDKLPDYIVHTSIDGGPVDAEKKEYHKMAANYMKKEADLSVEHPTEEEEDADEVGDIYFISVESFEDDLEYEKKECEWFVEDDVIVDDFGEEIEDRDILFGDLLTEDLREDVLVADPKLDCCFIRNKNVMYDYSISIIYDEYRKEDK